MDEYALQVLNLKRARLRSFENIAGELTWLNELPRFLKWIVSHAALRVYVREIMHMHDDEERALDREVRHAVRELQRLAEKVRERCPDVATDDGWPEPLSWRVFQQAARHAETARAAAADRRTHSGELVQVLHARATEALKGVGQQRMDLIKFLGQVMRRTARHRHLLQEWATAEQTSPRTALIRLVDLCRATNPPVDGLAHWTDFVPRDRFQPFIDHHRLKNESRPLVVGAGQVAVDRFVEELHVLGATTLSNRGIIERFKERCSWYDKARMRAVAQEGPGLREDRLTLELAKYLHDNGVVVLVRPRLGNLEPDAVGLRGLALEAKAYEEKRSPRAEIIKGYYQLHAYMTSLEASATRVQEGFLVTFRLGGSIYDTPKTLVTGRFVIHSMTIDLGEGATSGRRQPPTKTITEAEILGSLKNSPKLRGRQSARSAREGRRR